MHELSIALRIVEVIEAELAHETAVSVEKVNLQIGGLAGVVPEALQFSWEFAVENTRLQGSELDIQVVDAVGFCPQCGQDRALTNLQLLHCPVCQSPITQITGGNELEILTIEVLDRE